MSRSPNMCPKFWGLVHTNVGCIYSIAVPYKLIKGSVGYRHCLFDLHPLLADFFAKLLLSLLLGLHSTVCSSIWRAYCCGSPLTAVPC